MNGTVKWFNKKKGYGFIKGEDDKDYFVHYTSVPRGVFLKDNDQVTFDPVQNEKGLQSQNVNKVGESSSEKREAPKMKETENIPDVSQDESENFENEDNFGDESDDEF